MRETIKLLFVCTGNICRSPLAHRLFEHLIREKGLDTSFEIESAGTNAQWHEGENADPRMRKVARAHGLVLDHYARQLRISDFQYYDYILAMAHDHMHHMQRLVATENETKALIELFRDYDPQENGDVPDPYYDGVEGFEKVYVIVERTCQQLLQNLYKKF